MLMKAVRPRETDASRDLKNLIRYALSIKEASGLVLGMDSKKVVDSNLDLLRNFQPMDANEMDALTARLELFYQHRGLPWLDKGYYDRYWNA